MTVAGDRLLPVNPPSNRIPATSECCVLLAHCVTTITSSAVYYKGMQYAALGIVSQNRREL
jgi:hypothetical protein